ncbi:MAG TPA: hypothetical protein VD994_19980, partial [Prosthecobacter sp.]|nr:hypothetical protein [Prosthecobacter sp.]
TALPARDGGDFQAKMDPYGVLSPAPSPLGAYDFDSLPPDRTASFLDAVAMNSKLDFPAAADLLPGALPGSRAEANGVSHAHHSIWIGGPLVDDGGKKAAIMRTLEFHKANNLTWSVNLWTDVSRADLHAAAPESDVGKFKLWAEANQVNLLNVDEVFGPDTRMSLQGHFKLEENKKGTGYAAASDILRLEALNRFGGIYTDGDDKVKVKFSEAAAGVAADPGVLAATVNASTSNCVFCAVKGSPGVGAMLQRVGQNYELSRDEFLARTKLSPAIFASLPPAERVKIGESNDAARSEVINRSGPTVAKQILESPDNRNNIPADHLEVDTANTSWTSRVPMPGTPDVLQLQAALANPPAELHDRIAQAAQAGAAAAQNAPALPAELELSVQDLEKCNSALKKSVTTLAYQLRNEAKLDAAPGAQGVLDLNHATPYLRDLPLEQRLLVMDAIVNTLASPPFQPVSQTIFAVKLPKNLDLPDATLDKLFDPARFPHARMDTAAVQDAALRGDMRFLEYARQRNQLPEPDARAGVFLEAGRFKARAGGATIGENQGGRLTLMEAALKGGSQNAVLFLLNQPGANVAVQNNPQWATMAGKFGQPQALVDFASLGSAINHPSASAVDYDSPSLALLHTTLEANMPPDHLAELPAVRAAVLNYTLAGLDQQNPPMGLQAAGEQLAVHVVEERDFATLEHLMQRGLTIEQVPVDQRVPLARALADNAVTPENAQLAVQFATSYGPAAEEMTVNLAKALVQKANTLETSERAIEFALAHGPAAEAMIINLGQEAMTGNKAFLLASLLKKSHPSMPYEELLATAENDIARAAFPDIEAIKNDHAAAPVRLEAGEALTLIHKALAYTEAHLDKAQGGRADRVAGWNQLMDRIKAEHPTNHRIQAAADHAQARLQVLAGTRTSVRDSLARNATSLRKSIAEHLPGHQAGGGLGH